MTTPKNYLNFVPAEPFHAFLMAPYMRQSDVDEIYAASGKEPFDALLSSVLASRHAHTGMVEDEPVLMFGVGTQSMLSTVGVPWLLATHEMDEWAYTVGKMSKGFLLEMIEDFDYLVNYVDVRNVRSIKWLRWLGFNIHEPEPYGPFGMPFHKFDMEAAHV